ncbi:MAG: WecB/TagA/CpsF family glycosyltransferase [Sphingobacteriaceae bacterium]|nr:WecB/TagA/CpsF family glycosyltransferase [Sphingobacteriaceae bacterium]MBK7816790.1 WecB/TagA/CpsF family glycosyltransferase [Sphingobacteriaceae bacterium]
MGIDMDKGKNKKRILTLNIDIISYSETLQKIVELATSRKPSYICFANVHMAIEAHQHQKFSEQVNNADLVLADGMPLVKSLRSFYGINQDRVAGMDLMPDVIKIAEERKLKIFFFGSSNDLLEKIKLKAMQLYPGIEIAGTFSPPFDQPINNSIYIDMINNSNANIVLVALGCPKQEKWMAENSGKIFSVVLGVGGAFATFAGTVNRAPEFMRKVGLEWLFRLGQEPQRLFARYFKTNTRFIYLTLIEKLKSTFGNKNAFN